MISNHGDGNRVRFGLVGYQLTHSFSPAYFNEKFKAEGLRDFTYDLFSLETVDLLPDLFEDLSLHGLNVTIPFKQTVIKHLDRLDAVAEEIGAVNTIVRIAEGLKGYNTDAQAFQTTISSLIPSFDGKALILGTGGAARAVRWGLDQLHIPSCFVSRHAAPDKLTYGQLSPAVMDDYRLIINVTPLGMYPDPDACPDLNFELISREHILYDLIYNPEKTLFLSRGEVRGATIKNGLEMLHLQADFAWKIWKSHLDAEY